MAILRNGKNTEQPALDNASERATYKLFAKLAQVQRFSEKALKMEQMDLANEFMSRANYGLQEAQVLLEKATQAKQVARHSSL